MINQIRDLLFVGEKEITIHGITLYEYTIRDIFRIGNDNFKRAVYFSALEPIDLFKRSEVTKAQFKDVTMFDLFPDMNANHIEWCETMLGVATKKTWNYNKVTNNFDCIEYVEGKPKILRINKTNYDDIASAIRTMYVVTRYDPYEKYGDYDKAEDFVKEIIDEQVEIESKEENAKITMSSIVEGVACHADSGLNVLNIGDATIYQLFRVYERIQQKNVYDNHMRAMYSGCLKEETKIDIYDISWVKNLDI